MIISELRVYDFRQFKSVDGAPGLKITFHKGLNALIGENDSGKTAVIDALKLVLLTQSNEYIRPSDEDFYKPVGEDACSEFKIDCTISGFTQNEAKNFIEYLSFNQTENGIEYTLELHYRAWKEGHKIYQELRVGDIDDGISMDGKARELLKAVYLKPLRDAEREMSSGRGSRISQILLNHPVFKGKKEHTVLDIFRDANQRIEDYFTDDTDGKRILQTIRSNLDSFSDKGQASDAELKTSDIQLKAILESLSLNAPEINPGLGELNLLFIAAELLLLKDDTDGGLKLALIEELEAHLHPQAQLRLISYLQNEYNESNFETGGQFSDRINHTQALHIRGDGALCIGKQKKPLAGVGKASAGQYKELLAELLKDEGIIRYQDAYVYASVAIDELPAEYTDLFSSRFQYVFIDEYQDCNNLQRQAIDVIFDPQKCAVFKIGDSDQAIYNSAEDTTPDWMPQPDFLPIVTSCRFNQEIANVICKLKKSEKNIVTLAGATGVKPVLLVFSPENIDRVIGGFISALDRHELYDNNGIYKAIGAVKREDLSGLKIGSYWTEFDGSANKKNEYSYWVLVDEIVQYLLEGKLYKAEQSVRRLLCRVFHYISIKHPVSGKDYTIVAMKNALDEKYRGQYRQWIYEMSRIQTIDRHSVDQLLRQKINELLRIGNPSLTDIFTVLPAFFLEESTGVNHADIAEKNVLIDPIRGRRIIFDTIHSVKGETHDATLYLETDRQGASDLNRILPYFGVGRCGSSSLYDSSRKLAYVGMSRPKKLLCVAMQAETYEKSKGIFDADWEVVDLRG